MIKLIGFAIGMSVASSAMAFTDDDCFALGQVAESVMEARQRGASMQDLLTVANQPDFAAMKEGLRLIVMIAFEQPQYSGTANQQRAIKKFSEEVQLYCMKNFQ